VLWYSQYSNADVVSVPIGNGLTVSVMTGSNIPELQNIKTNPAATQVQLDDDGNVNVPLQFQFPYFGQRFSNSWMHSNGVVSFQNPSVTGNFCCSGVDLSKTTDSRYNYAIMPLWTDLYALNGASTYVLGTESSVTYGWYGTGQYANSNNRSSFEVKLDSTGTLDMRWSGAIVSSAIVTMGFTGNLSRGEYYQNYNGSSVNIPGLGVSYTGARQHDPTPVTTPTTNTVTVTTTATTISSTTADTPSQTVNVGGVQLSTSGEIAAPDNIPQALKDVQAISKQSQASGPSATVMNVIGRIQANEKAMQTLSMQNANKASAQASAKSQEQSMAIVESLTNMSMESSQSSQQVNSTQQIIQSVSQSTDMMMGTPLAVTNYSMSSAYVASRTFNNENETENSLANLTISRNTSVSMIAEVRTNIESLQNEQPTETVKKDIQPNDLAGGVDIAAMATQPKGFDVYAMTVLKDNAFYAPKDIYLNQKTVDNARAFRSLSSDRLHQEMVDQQYRR